MKTFTRILRAVKCATNHHVFVPAGRTKAMRHDGMALWERVICVHCGISKQTGDSILIDPLPVHAKPHPILPPKPTPPDSNGRYAGLDRGEASIGMPGLDFAVGLAGVPYPSAMGMAGYVMSHKSESPSPTFEGKGGDFGGGGASADYSSPPSYSTDTSSYSSSSSDSSSSSSSSSSGN